MPDLNNRESMGCTGLTKALPSISSASAGHMSLGWTLCRADERSGFEHGRRGFVELGGPVAIWVVAWYSGASSQAERLFRLLSAAAPSISRPAR
jgi:hypothetical protein